MQTPEQLASLRERGYCVLRGVIPPLALRSLNGVIDAQLTASPVPSAEQVERARSNVYSFSQPGEGRGEGVVSGVVCTVHHGGRLAAVRIVPVIGVTDLRHPQLCEAVE